MSQQLLFYKNSFTFENKAHGQVSFGVIKYMKGVQGMVELDSINRDTSPFDDEVSFESISFRDAFFEWLSAGNAKKYPAEVILSCIDRISEYAVLKKISTSSLWEYKKNDAFKPIYKRLLEAKLLRITDRNVYKVFIVAGQLYLRFLRERPWKTVATKTIDLAVSGVDDKAIEQILNESTAVVKKEQADTEAIILSQDLTATSLVFKKEVDWSLLNYGFTIPQSAIDAFCSNIDGEVLRGSSLHIKLMVGENVYPATLSNVGFSSDTRKQLQVRYSASSRAAGALQEIFRASYDFLMAKKNNNVSNVKLENKEYVDVVCVSSGIYRLICYPLINGLRLETNTCTRKKTVKEALIEFSDNHKGEIKTTNEISEELSIIYGHSILPVDYQIGLNSIFKKLFRRIDHGTYMCLGYNAAETTVVSSPLNYGSAYSLVSDEEKEKIMSIVAKKFKSGFRRTSNIDFERFKNYYADECGEEFPYAADRLDYLLSSEAVIFDDRVYVYGDEVTHAILVFLEQLDSPCIYIDVFFNKYSDELYAFSIFSVEMLRVFIEKNYYGISIKYDYILMKDNVSPADLIKEVFCERETWSFDELQKKLPCLKIDTIRQTLNSAEYFRVDTGTYTHIDNMDLPDGEGEKILVFVESKLQERDYITANELDLSKFESLNPHCSFAAIRDAVFYKFLSNGYEKSGQVITKKGCKLRVLDILEQYCREAETVSFDELNAFEATFDPEGRTHSQCLIAGHNTMVRVSSELFVADGNVDFDVEKIDDAIALYCHDNFIPLRRVTDFSLFPYTGYQWNLFLLESYVRKFSRIFKYDVRAVNSANIGTIVRKSFDYNGYDDILAIALANSSVRLSDKKAIGNYLFDNGYIGWRNLGKCEEKIIENAKKLREGGTV